MEIPRHGQLLRCTGQRRRPHGLHQRRGRHHGRIGFTENFARRRRKSHVALPFLPPPRRDERTGRHHTRRRWQSPRSATPQRERVERRRRGKGMDAPLRFARALCRRRSHTSAVPSPRASFARTDERALCRQHLRLRLARARPQRRHARGREERSESGRDQYVYPLLSQQRLVACYGLQRRTAARRQGGLHRRGRGSSPRRAGKHHAHRHAQLRCRRIERL